MKKLSITKLFDTDLSRDGYVLTVERVGCGDMTLYKDEAVTLMRILEAWTPRMIQFRPPSNIGSDATASPPMDMTILQHKTRENTSA